MIDQVEDRPHKMKSKPILRQRLVLLKQHHDELHLFFSTDRQIERDVDSAYRNYKGVAIVADVIAALVHFSNAAYKSVDVALTAASKREWAKRALLVAYRPIKTVLTELSGTQADFTLVERVMSASNMVGNALTPSYWAKVVANMKSGH